MLALFQSHRQFHYYPDPTAAAAGCVKAGISVFLDQFAAPLRDALDKKLVTESDIEHNIKGNLRMRMRLESSTLPGCRPMTRYRTTRALGTARKTGLWL